MKSEKTIDTLLEATLFIRKKEISAWVNPGLIDSSMSIICRQSPCWTLITNHLTWACLFKSTVTQWLWLMFCAIKRTFNRLFTYWPCWAPDFWWRTGKWSRYCCHHNLIRTKACIFGKANIASKSEGNFNVTSFSSHRFVAYMAHSTFD